MFRDPRVWVTGVVPLALTAAWYWHAHEIFLRTGLTMGILGAPTKFYPAYVSPGPWPSIYSKWSTSALLADPEFYRRMFMRFYHLLLLPVGFVGALLGALVWRGWGRVVLGGLAGLERRVLLHRRRSAPRPRVLPVAVRRHRRDLLRRGGLAGVRRRVAAIARLGDGLRPVGRGGRALTVAAIASFYASGVTESHFAPRGMAREDVQAGQAIDAVTADNDLAVVVDDYGIMSPILLYFAHLKGWSFDPGDLSPEVVDNLRRLGARYFVTTQWSRSDARAPEATASSSATRT